MSTTKAAVPDSRKNRNPSIEWLRVIAMLMVTMIHALGWGGGMAPYEFGSMGYFVFRLLDTLCHVAVNAFVLITGYFMSTGRLRPSQLVKLAVQVETYSLASLAVAALAFHQPLTPSVLLHSLLPLTGQSYWFASAYALLLLVSPLLNRLIDAMDQKAHFAALLLLTAVFCVVPNLAFWSQSFMTSGADLTWFIVLYLTSAYIRRYGKNHQKLAKWSSGKWLAGYAILSGGGVAQPLRFGLGHASHIRRNQAGGPVLFL